MSSAFKATQTSHTRRTAVAQKAAGQNLSTNHSEHVVAGAAFKALIDVCSPGATVDIVADHVIALWGMISRVRCVQAATNECSAGEIRPHTFQSCQL